MPQNPQAIIARKKQRLEKLEERQAIMGISTPLEVVTEFEDLRREIGDYGRAELSEGERRMIVRQRLQAAARRRGLALRFRPGRGPLNLPRRSGGTAPAEGDSVVCCRAT